jgi:hypothetical protein
LQDLTLVPFNSKSGIFITTCGASLGLALTAGFSLVVTMTLFAACWGEERDKVRHFNLRGC